MLEDKPAFNALLRLFALAVLIGLTVFLSYQFGIIELFLNKEKFENFIQSLGPLGIVGFIILQAFQVVIAPIPGEIPGLLGGYLYGIWGGVLFSTIGLTLGSAVAFTLGRVFGKPFVEKIVNKTVLNKFDYLLDYKGAFLVFFLFLIPGFPKDYLSYFLGLSKLSLVNFTVIAGFGRLFGTVLLSLGGDYLRHHDYEKFLILAGIAVVVIVTVWLFKKQIERFFRIWHVSRYKKNKNKNELPLN